LESRLICLWLLLGRGRVVKGLYALNALNPLLTVHIKGYHRERVRYGVTGSSLRINLGAGFNDELISKFCILC
jgi:hypothetical protein